MKRWELASLIAVTPEHLSRLLRQLRDDGVIRVNNGTIVVPDVRRLAAGERRGGRGADDSSGFGGAGGGALNAVRRAGGMATATGEIDGWRAHLSPSETHPAGTELLPQGRTPERVHLLSDGVVKLVRRDAGRPPATVGLRFPGWLLGAESVIAGQGTPVAVVAASDCTVRGLARERFLGFVRVDPDLSWRVAQMYSREMVDRLERAGARDGVPPETRLKHLLRRLIDANDTGCLQQEVHLRLPFTHRELARLLSVSASQLTALLARLQRDDVIRLRRDRLIITDLRGLCEVDPAGRDVGWPVNA